MRDMPRTLSLSLLRVTEGMGVLTHKGCTLREKRGMMQSYLPTLACSQVLDRGHHGGLGLGERTKYIGWDVAFGSVPKVQKKGGWGPAAQLIDILPYGHVNVRRVQVALLLTEVLSGIRTVQHIGPCRGW